MLYHYISLTNLDEGQKRLSRKGLSYCNEKATSKEMNGPVTLGFKLKRKNAKTGGDDQCQKRKRRPPPRVWELLMWRCGGEDGAGRWRARVYCLVLSSFSSSMSFLEALTLLETSFPWEKRRWRSLKVRLSGASLGMEFSCSWLQTQKTLLLKHFTNISFIFHIDCFPRKRWIYWEETGLTSWSICPAGPCRLLPILQLLLSFQCTR